MKVPTWGYILGAVMMIFGSCDALSEAQAVMTPQILDMQREALEDMEEEVDVSWEEMTGQMDSLMAENDSIPEMVKRLTEGFGTVFQMSEFSRVWTVRFGMIGLLVSIVYFLAGIFMMMIKKWSINLASAALLLSIAFEIIRTLVLNSDPDANSLFSMGYGISLIVSTIINVILLIVLHASDKTAYNADAFYNKTISEIGQE